MKRTKPPLNPPAPTSDSEKKSTDPKQSARAESLPLGLATDDPTQGVAASGSHRSPATAAPGQGNEPETGKPVPSSPEAQAPLRVPPILLEGDDPRVAPAAGTAGKFATGPKPEVGPWEIEGPKLPASYGTGRLSLAARDPSCLYAHWDLTREQQERCNQLCGQGQMLLRVHKDDLQGEVATEIKVEPASDHSFIQIDTSAGRYVAELGYHGAGSQWTPLAVSESVASLVRSSVQPQPIRIATLSFDHALGLTSESAGLPIPSPERSPKLPPFFPQVTLEHRASASVPTIPHPWPVGTTEAPLTGLPLTQPKKVPTTESLELMWPEIEVEEPSYRATWSPASSPSSSLCDWSPAQERALAEMIGWSILRQESLGSAGIEELIRAGRRPAVSAEEASSRAAAGLAAPISSGAFAQAAPAQQRGFWLNVNAELVIYGATESDATVVVSGRAIRLRPDGTFSYRFALPDGSYPLDVTAISSRGELQAVELEFRRDTVYWNGAESQPQDEALKAPRPENI